MPEIYLNCDKCQGLIPHRLRWDNTAVCYGCGGERDVDREPRSHITMMRARRQERQA